MIPSQACRLAHEIRGHGFICHIDVGNLGSCSVRILAMRLITPERRVLEEIGERHGCELHLISEDGLTYFAKREAKHG
jgi:hypothetical protein